MRRVNPAVVGLGVMFAAAAHAATITWTGNVGTDFATAGNWATNVVPASNDWQDTARFADTTPAPANKTPTLSAGRSLNGMLFESAGWTYGGTAQTIIRSISSSGAGTNTISAPLKTIYNNTWTINSGNTLNITNVLYQDSTWSLTLNGGGTLSVASSIEGWSSALKFYLNSGTVKIGGATPYKNGGVVYLQSAESVLQLKTTVAGATALIGTKIIDGTGQGLKVTDLGGGYTQIAIPEPTTLGMMGAMAGALLLTRRQRHVG